MLTSTVPTTSMNDFTTFNSSMTSSEHEDDFHDHPREPSNNTIMDSFESCSTLMRTERKTFIAFLLSSVSFFCCSSVTSAKRYIRQDPWAYSALELSLS